MVGGLAVRVERKTSLLGLRCTVTVHTPDGTWTIWERRDLDGRPVEVGIEPPPGMEAPAEVYPALAKSAEATAQALLKALGRRSRREAPAGRVTPEEAVRALLSTGRARILS